MKRRSQRWAVRLGKKLLMCAAAGMAFVGIAGALRIGGLDGLAFALLPIALAVVFVVLAVKPHEGPLRQKRRGRTRV